VKILLIDFNFTGKRILVVGGGTISYRKILKFLDAQAKIQVVSKSFSNEMKNLYKMKKINLIKADVKDAEKLIKSFDPKPDLVIAATGDRRLNEELTFMAKSMGCMVYAVDNPEISDFMLPALAEIGEVKLAISTGGRSPAMARILRQRIEKIITEEDLLQIELQFYVRGLLKRKVPNQRARKKILYKILENERISRLLKEKKFDDARQEAVKIIEEYISEDYVGSV
jgi:precorrin-2 dehydrogenase/sirohydrochlorin ferrochelatase